MISNSARKELMNSSFIIPSSGAQGAFLCGLCGGADLRVVVEIATEERLTVKIVCNSCFNFLDTDIDLRGEDERNN
jgi:hypothetical protein